MATPSVHRLDPAGDPLGFRHALGQYATGVTVITTQTAEGPAGITANSFASVSLDPPLILWSPARSSARFAIFSAAERFAVHVLGQNQRDVAAGFTRSKSAFAGLDWHASEEGVPLISGCLAVFECRFAASYPAGDHDIIVGRVSSVSTRPGAPLVFQAGRYGGFTAAS